MRSSNPSNSISSFESAADAKDWRSAARRRMRRVAACVAIVASLAPVVASSATDTATATPTTARMAAGKANAATASGGAAVAASPPRVSLQIAQGTLLGRSEQGLQVFRGIPFAGAPVGEWRWRPPRPAPSWRGVRDAGEFGPVCPQILQPGYTKEDLEHRPMSEDCLQLNVWTPQARAGAKRPVMVWILPGGFRAGDGGMAMYDGRALAERGVVVVTFNYRLGIFGEFAHPAMSRAQSGEPLANYHLMDQLAALRWVRANIDAFGGDAANVTIFGMSAGGMSVNYLMASPAAAGLFDKAISQSSALRMSHDRKLAEDVGKLPSLESEGARHAGKLGVGEGDAAAVLRGLRALSMQQLLDYQAKNPVGTSGGLNPVIDGRIVVEPVGRAFELGHEQPVPYMTGATSWEGSLIRAGVGALQPVLDLLALTREQVDPLYQEPDADRLAWKTYSDFFLATQRHLAAGHARHGRAAWVYRFSRVLDAHVGDTFGAPHGSETRYVFGTLDDLARAPGDRRPLEGWRVGASDRTYADLMARYWVNFATWGDPNGEGLPGWPARGANSDLLLEFGQQVPQVRRDFIGERQALFESQFAAGKL